jgi:hypothetical protein
MLFTMPNATVPARTLFAVAALAGALIVSGCAQMADGRAQPQAPAPPAAPAPAELPPPPPPEPEPPPAPPALPPLTPPMIQRTVMSAVEHLEAGEEALALVDLERVLQTDPGHRLAQSLMRQIKEDPQTLLGRESFAYRVQPGESLSRISQRFLNDVFMFYALARYNDIKVPRVVAGGQTIRVPGKAPPPGPMAAPPPAAAPAPPPAPVSAPTVPTAAPATPAAVPPTIAPAPRPAAASAVPAPPPAAAKPPPAPPAAAAPPDPDRAQHERDAAIARHTREARNAFAKQDLDGAIQSWDKVLELDPANTTAQLERQRAVALKERLRRVQ